MDLKEKGKQTKKRDTNPEILKATNHINIYYTMSSIFLFLGEGRKEKISKIKIPSYIFRKKLTNGNEPMVNRLRVRVNIDEGKPFVFYCQK